jgi:hypothetical protein
LFGQFRRNCLPALGPHRGTIAGQKCSIDRDIGDIWEKLGLFCADPKTVASNSILQVLIVLMGKRFGDATDRTEWGPACHSGTAEDASLGQINPEIGTPIGYAL